MSTYLKVIAVGNVGQDPETKTFQDGGQVSNLSIATTENWKDKQGVKQERTEWSRVVFNGKLSEIVSKYVSKGDKILIDGTLRTRKWTDANGKDNWTTEIVARSMTMLTPKGGNSSRPPQPPASAVDAYEASKNAENQTQSTNSLPEGEVDDLPF